MLRYVFRPNARDKEIRRLNNRLQEIIQEENKYFNAGNMAKYMQLDTERVRIEIKLGKLK